MCDPASLRLSARVTLASTETKFQKKKIVINKATAIKKVQSIQYTFNASIFKFATNDSGEINKQNGPCSSEIDVIQVSQQSFQLIVIGPSNKQMPSKRQQSSIRKL